MSSTQTLSKTALTSVYWKTPQDKHYIRVYFQDTTGTICEARWDSVNGWGSVAKCFQAPFNANIAAVVYPTGDDPQDNSGIHQDKPEIHIYQIQLGTPNSSLEYVKAAGADIGWTPNGPIPVQDLHSQSSLAAVEFADPFICVFYQNKDGRICMTECTNGTWAQSKPISSSSAPLGTPIAAAAAIRDTSIPLITLLRRDEKNTIVGQSRTIYGNLEHELTLNVPMSSSDATITVASWKDSQNSNIFYAQVYYDGTNNGIQKTIGTYSGGYSSVPTNIMNANDGGQGRLSAVAYAPPPAGRNTGSVFFQPPGTTFIQEFLF